MSLDALPMFTETENLAYFRARDMLGNLNTRMLDDLVGSTTIVAESEEDAVKQIIDVATEKFNALCDVAQTTESYFKGAYALFRATYGSVKWVHENCKEMISHAIALGSCVDEYREAISCYMQWLRGRIARCDRHAKTLKLFPSKWFCSRSVQSRIDAYNDKIIMANKVINEPGVEVKWGYTCASDPMGFNSWWMEVLNPITFAIFESSREHKVPLDRVVTIIHKLMNVSSDEALSKLVNQAYRSHLLASSLYIKALYQRHCMFYEMRVSTEPVKCPSAYRCLYHSEYDDLVGYAKSVIQEHGELVGCAN